MSYRQRRCEISVTGILYLTHAALDNNSLPHNIAAGIGRSRTSLSASFSVSITLSRAAKIALFISWEVWARGWRSLLILRLMWEECVMRLEGRDIWWSCEEAKIFSRRPTSPSASSPFCQGQHMNNAPTPDYWCYDDRVISTRASKSVSVT